MKRVDYQNPQNNLEEVNEKRNAEIRAYGQRVLAEADAAQRGDVTTIDDWDVLDVEAEVEPPAPTEPQPEQPVVEPEPEIEEPEAEKEPEIEEKTEEKPKPEPKKTPAKAAAAPKEASSKEQ